MFKFVASIIASWLEKLGWQWWVGHKTEEANAAENKVISLSDDELNKRVHSEITRK